jgi:hypothetical protein
MSRPTQIGKAVKLTEKARKLDILNANSGISPACVVREVPVGQQLKLANNTTVEWEGERFGLRDVIVRLHGNPIITYNWNEYYSEGEGSNPVFFRVSWCGYATKITSARINQFSPIATRGWTVPVWWYDGLPDERHEHNGFVYGHCDYDGIFRAKRIKPVEPAFQAVNLLMYDPTTDTLEQM